MNQKVLSIVVPCYNCEHYIIKLVSHIPFKQLNNEVELILIDDGSKDNTLNALYDLQKHYGEENVKVYTKPNGNWGSVHNFAKTLDLQGRFVKSLDSDDYFDTDALFQFVNFLKSIPDDIELVFSNINFVDSKGNILDSKDYKKKKVFRSTFFDLNSTKISRYALVTIHSFCSKKELYQKIPDLPVEMSYMDQVLIFYLYYFSNNKCAYFDGPAVYQYHSGREDQTVSRKNFALHYDWIRIMFETELKFAVDNKIFGQVSKRKAKILRECLLLGFYNFVYATTYKKDLRQWEISKLQYQELKTALEILDRDPVAKKYFKTFDIKYFKLTKFVGFPFLVHCLAWFLNRGFIQITQKDGKRSFK